MLTPPLFMVYNILKRSAIMPTRHLLMTLLFKCEQRCGEGTFGHEVAGGNCKPHHVSSPLRMACKILSQSGKKNWFSFTCYLTYLLQNGHQKIFKDRLFVVRFLNIPSLRTGGRVGRPFKDLDSVLPKNLNSQQFHLRTIRNM